MENFIIETKGLTKYYGDTAVVKGVDIHVKKGEIYALLGRNGAGKTTLMRMITGMLPKSSGSIEIFQTPIEEIKDKTVISICTQFNTHLLNELTPNEHFKIYSWFFQKEPEYCRLYYFF